MRLTAPVLGLAAFAGLALGSYAVTAAIRFARAEQSWRGRSHCDRCDAPLDLALTLPLAGYVLAAGRCRACQAPIDRWHLVGEVAGLAVLVSASLVGDPVRAPLMVLLGLSLIATMTVDQKIGRLPDGLTLAIAALAAVLAMTQSLTRVLLGFAAAVISLAVFQGLRWTRERRGLDPGLGLGDVKLVGALALWLGPATPIFVAGAAILGLGVAAIVRPTGGRLAFGPMLAVSGWITGLVVEGGLWPTIA